MSRKNACRRFAFWRITDFDRVLLVPATADSCGANGFGWSAGRVKAPVFLDHPGPEGLGQLNVNQACQLDLLIFDICEDFDATQRNGL